MASGSEFCDSTNFISVVQFNKECLCKDSATLCSSRYENERLKWSADFEVLKLFSKVKVRPNGQMVIAGWKFQKV